MKSAIAALFFALIAVPTAASACGPYGSFEPFDWDLQRLDLLVDSADQNGELTLAEYRSATRQVARLYRVRDYFNRDGGFSATESKRMRSLVNDTRSTIERVIAPRRVATRQR